MRIFLLAFALAIGGGAAAQASCADEFKQLQERVARQMTQHPQPAQAVAATKQLNKASENMNHMDEVDCYNAVARIRRILATPEPPVEAQDQGAMRPR
jgi:hypothetical protein